MPHKWQVKRPAIHIAIAAILFFTFFAAAQSNTKGMNPNMKPPVTPNKVPNPLLKPENTGIPIVPIVMYRLTDKVPALIPNSKPVIAMARVCNVAGTPEGIGIASWDITAIIAVNIPVYAICFVRVIILFIIHYLGVLSV